MNSAWIAFRQALVWSATVFVVGGFPIIAQLLHRLFVPVQTYILWDTADGWFYILVVATAALAEAARFIGKQTEVLVLVIVLFISFVIIAVFGYVSLSFYVIVSPANASGIQVCGLITFVALALSSLICVYFLRYSTLNQPPTT